MFVPPGAVAPPWMVVPKQSSVTTPNDMASLGPLGQKGREGGSVVDANTNGDRNSYYGANANRLGQNMPVRIYQFINELMSY